MSSVARRICVVPRVQGVGGMVSFLHKFSAGALVRGVTVTSDPGDLPYDALLVIGGTRQLASLYRARRRGVGTRQRRLKTLSSEVRPRNDSGLGGNMGRRL